ncbi:MAG: hypothetical protein ACI4UK_04765 [Floccifex sp.]
MKKLGLCFVFCLALMGCQKGIVPTKEDCLEVAMDDANVTVSEITESSLDEKKGNYIIVFETETGHYEYTIGKDGIIKDRIYSALSEEKQVEQEEEKEVEPEPEQPVEPSGISAEDQARALEVACVNMGISTSDPQNVSITMEDGLYVVRFDFGEGVTYVTTIDPNSFEATSSYSI